MNSVMKEEPATKLPRLAIGNSAKQGVECIVAIRHFFANRSLALSLGLVATLLCSPAVQAIVSTPAFPLHTQGAHIVDKNGVRVRLNGAAWYGGESSDFVVAGLQAATLQGIVQQIQSQGLNTIRIPWSNQLYESNPVVASSAVAANPSMVGQHALTIMDQVIAALTNAGIMVILDNHNSDAEWCCSTSDGNTLWYNSNYPESNWLSDWEGMALRYKSNPLVIGADLRNEPRGAASWGGSAATDWHAAAQRGGNAVLGVNPNLLIFVEGVNYALDLSGVASLPVQLNVANQVVYSPHDYGFDYSVLTSYSDYVSRITPNWGYLASGSNPQPLWIGEFGTCNSSSGCVSSTFSSDNGFWFSFLASYAQQYGLDWSYWALNGTQSTGSSRTYGSAETYGILNTSWSGSALSALTTQLEAMAAATPNVSIFPGSSISIANAGLSGSSTVSIVPLNGFTGAVSLSCAVSGGTAGKALPTCIVPASVSVTGSSAVTASVSINTLASGRMSKPLWGAAGGSTLACVFLLVLPARRRKVFLPLLLLAIAALSQSACGGGGGGGNTVVHTTPASYALSVTATIPGGSPVTTQISVKVQ